MPAPRKSLQQQLAERKAERLAARAAHKSPAARATKRAPRRRTKVEGLEKLWHERVAREAALAKSPKLQRAYQRGLVIQREAMRNQHARYNSVPYSLLVFHGIIEERPLVALDVDPQVVARVVAAGLAAPVWRPEKLAGIDAEIAALLHSMPAPEPESRDEGDDGGEHDEEQHDLAA